MTAQETPDGTALPRWCDLPLKAVFLRSFFIQAGWNYERFQNLGFAFALKPALERIWPDRAGLKAALLRHLGLVNTQPYMAGYVLGNVAGMEARAAADPDPAARLKSLPGVKQALATSFASIGDRVFWGRLKPMTTQVCLLVWTLCGFCGWLFTGNAREPAAWVVFAGPLAGIAGYAAVSVAVRWKGLNGGCACGGTATCGLDEVDWPRAIRLLSFAGYALSLVLALAALAMFTGACGCGGDVLLRFGLAALVLALHRAARHYGRSVLSAAGFVLAASLLFFGVLRLEPPKIYGL